MILGRCKAEGTSRFAERAIKRGVNELHFKRVNDLVVSSIGIGTYLGDPDPITDAYMIEAVKNLLSSGACNVVDTAINYRFMRSERCVGTALKELVGSGELKRDEVLLCSKAGYLTYDAEQDADYEEYVLKHIVSEGIARIEEIAAGIHCMSPRYLTWSVEKSLENMGVETLDVLYLHNAAESQVPVVGKGVFWDRLRESLRALEELRSEGKIAYYGLATWSSLRVPPSIDEHLNLSDVVELCKEIAGQNYGFKLVQLPFNVAMTEAATLRNQDVGGELLTVFEAAKMLGLSVVTNAPLLEGVLLRSYKGPLIDGLTLAQTLIQIARSSPASVVLVGQKSPEHVKENSELVKFPPLSEEEFLTYVRPSGLR